MLFRSPSIDLATYFPGENADGVCCMARDAQGMVYLAGFTFSELFPRVSDEFRKGLGSNLRDGWVMKIDPKASGNDLILYSSYFGATAEEDIFAMTVDAQGLVYLAGVTNSFDFPTTPNGFVTSFQGGTNRIFVSVLDTTKGEGGLFYSTLFGGTKGDQATAIAVRNGKIYVTGFTTSDDFPVVNALQGTKSGSYDGFIAQFDPSAGTGKDSLPFSSYFGASGQDIPRAIAVDASGAVYVSGITYSFDFPVTPDAYQPFYRGQGDSFVTKIDIGANAILYSTYFGGSGTDYARKMILDAAGRVALTGYTFSSNLPVTQNALQTVNSGNGDAFLTVLDPNVSGAGGLVYSTYFGGSDGDVAYDVARDTAGRYVICGYTLSQDFPVRNALNPMSAQGGADGFVAVIDPGATFGSALAYSSLITSDGLQTAYACSIGSDGVIVTGVSTGVLFGPNDSQPTNVGGYNVFLLIFRP